MGTLTPPRAAARHGLLLIALAAMLWGTVGVTTKLLYQVSATNPLSIGFFRLGLAAPVLTVLAWSQLGRRIFAVARRDLLIMALIGAMQALSQVCYFAAIAGTGVAVATLVTICTAPVLVALLSVVLTRERPSKGTVLALCCALAGTPLLVAVPSAVSHVSVAGVFLALMAAVFYAIMTLASRVLADRYHPLQITAFGFSIGAAFLLPLALVVGFVASYPPAGWLLLACLGLFPSALGYVLFQAGMRTTPATAASVVTLLEPLTATFLAALLFGERIGPGGVPGALLLLGAVAILYRGAS